MSRRKGPKVELVPTSAILHADGELEVMGGALSDVREAAKVSPGARAILLVEADPDREAVVKHAMQILAEHFEANDPYVDDYPSARAAGAEHRKTCRHCAAYLRWLRKQNSVEKLQRKGRK